MSNVCVPFNVFHMLLLFESLVPAFILIISCGSLDPMQQLQTKCLDILAS